VGRDYRADLDLVFANSGGTPLMPILISATVSRICKRLGLTKGVSLHTVRHTHASLLLEEGAGLATISERMGHSSVRTTADIYSPRSAARITRPPMLGRHHLAIAERGGENHNHKLIHLRQADG